MTVTTTISAQSFAANGVTVNFPFNFRFFANTDLVVTSITPLGVATTLLLNTDYSVIGAGTAAGGTVTTVVPPANGNTLNVARVLVPNQLVDIRNQGRFYPEVHEDVFDRLTMLIQQALNNNGQALLFPITDTPGLLKTLPNVTARANRLMGFDALGQPTASTLTTTAIEEQAGIAAGSAALAQKWAENPEDVPVVPGSFSALHWAEKSNDSAIAAAAIASAASNSATNAGTSATNAATSETNAAALLLVAQKQIQTISATVAANALTLGWTRTGTSFRSPTLTSGAVNSRNPGANLTLVVPSGATLGTQNGVLARLVLLLIDNAGTVELAVTNMAGGLSLDETGLISTTAISAAATSASVIYSTTARSNVPYRVVGFADSSQAAAGTWATAPSLVQGIGGQALGALGSIGFGQTEQLFTVGTTRVNGTTYTNLTGRPIEVCIMFTNSASVSFAVNGVVKMAGGTAAANFFSTSFIVPHGATYVVSGAQSWSELR